jgi:hypoxanthine phosphoribosyltransferase
MAHDSWTGAGMQTHSDIIAEILIDEKTLKKRIKALGKQISQDYTGQDLLLICILRGGLVFMVDLMRHITVPHALDCMALTSYGVGARTSSGNIRMSLDLQTNIENKNVLLVEDIVDSGHTLFHVLEMLQTRHPKSLKVCALLDKEERREISVPIHYRGFSIPNKFVFGYGLDLDEYYRNLPFVAVLDIKKYKPPSAGEKQTG